MAKPKALKASESLDKAADEMMIRGKAEGYMIVKEDTTNQVQGSVCALGALALANGVLEEEIDRTFNEGNAGLLPGAKELTTHLVLKMKLHEDPEFEEVFPWDFIPEINDNKGYHSYNEETNEGEFVAVDIQEEMRLCAKDLREQGK